MNAEVAFIGTTKKVTSSEIQLILYLRVNNVDPEDIIFAAAEEGGEDRGGCHYAIQYVSWEMVYVCGGEGVVWCVCG